MWKVSCFYEKCMIWLILGAIPLYYTVYYSKFDQQEWTQKYYLMTV